MGEKGQVWRFKEGDLNIVGERQERRKFLDGGWSWVYD